jgi:hypothetical protein
MNASLSPTRRFFLASLAAVALAGTVSAAERITMKQDDDAGRIDILVDGRPAFAYRYGPAVDLAHYYPLLSPSGKNMLVQVTDPYPHHRSFWFVDRVQLDDGPVVNVYNSNTVDGTTEGLAVFQWPDGNEHKWLTREYGTFGPRRPDAQSGERFTVAKGDSIRQRVGVLVHRGDVKSGRVGKRYERFVGGEL